MLNLPYGFDIYLVNVNSMRKIGQIFVAFSEKLNFTTEGPINAGVVRRNVSKCLDYVNFNGVINSFAGTQLLIALSPPPSPLHKS